MILWWYYDDIMKWAQDLRALPDQSGSPWSWYCDDDYIWMIFVDGWLDDVASGHNIWIILKLSVIIIMIYDDNIAGLQVQAILSRSTYLFLVCSDSTDPGWFHHLLGTTGLLGLKPYDGMINRYECYDLLRYWWYEDDNNVSAPTPGGRASGGGWACPASPTASRGGGGGCTPAHDIMRIWQYADDTCDDR